MDLTGERTEPRLRVLVMTKVFPNSVNKNGAAFNRQQFAALSRSCDLRILGLIPWFPGARLFRKQSEAGRLVTVPSCECIDGLDVRHPRVFFFPRFGYAANPMMFALSLLPAVLPLRKKIDVLMASWAFPDGVAAVHLGRWLKLPVVVKVHGSDLNVLPQYASIRRALTRNLPCAERIVAVSRPLATKARELGVPEDRIAVIPNGVNRALFSPRDRAEARRELGLADGPIVLFVGRLEEPKGVLDLLQAFELIAAASPDLRLAVVGDGSQMQKCLQAQTKWPGRIFVPGSLPLPEVARWLAACDILTLPSWNEGTPNVVLEALASGRRVVATRVGGIPDIITSPALGEMVAPRQPDELAKALVQAAHEPYDPMVVAAGGPPGWQQSADLLHQVLRSARFGTPLSPGLRISPPS